ncbi:hypothetical protein BGZ49_008856 [Haplosporangium sp. Z 27]|nr:hypothetical protein BGZ49_008856 [Haplosporangium sp. Z 27]
MIIGLDQPKPYILGPGHWTAVMETLNSLTQGINISMARSVTHAGSANVVTPQPPKYQDLLLPMSGTPSKQSCRLSQRGGQVKTCRQEQAFRFSLKTYRSQSGFINLSTVALRKRMSSRNMTNDITADYLECETMPAIPDGPAQMRSPSPHCRLVKDPDLPEEGSIARLSIPEQDGHFSSARYLAQWPAYIKDLNKATMDIARYAGAHAFLRIPVSRPNKPQRLSDNTLIPFEFSSTAVGESMLAVGKGMSAIGEGWSKISNAIGPRLSESVKRQICLGFKRYEHTIKAIAAHGIPQYRFEEVVDALIKIAKVKNQDVEELRNAMIILEYTDDYANQTTNTVDIAFGTLAADFTIAPDTMITEKKKVGWFGLKHEETTEFRDVPHTITYNDTLLLNTYFEVVAYRQMAGVLALPMPDYPSMASMCTIA